MTIEGETIFHLQQSLDYRDRPQEVSEPVEVLLAPTSSHDAGRVQTAQ